MGEDLLRRYDARRFGWSTASHQLQTCGNARPGQGFWDFLAAKSLTGALVKIQFLHLYPGRYPTAQDSVMKSLFQYAI
jgi:hypothetical protein